MGRPPDTDQESEQPAAAPRVGGTLHSWRHKVLRGSQHEKHDFPGSSCGNLSDLVWHTVREILQMEGGLLQHLDLFTSQPILHLDLYKTLTYITPRFCVKIISFKTNLLLEIEFLCEISQVIWISVFQILRVESSMLSFLHRY